MPSDEDALIRAEIRFKNARLLDAILAQDLPILDARSEAGAAAKRRGRIAWFCEFHELPRDLVYHLINLKRNPWTSGRLQSLPQRLCALLEREPLWLFPVRIYAACWRQQQTRYLSARHVETIEDMAKLIRGRLTDVPATLTTVDAPDAILALDEREQMIQRALVTLTPREENVVQRRHGLKTHNEETLREIADAYEVTPERIRQIERRAMGKLRHPSRSRSLAPFVTV